MDDALSYDGMDDYLHARLPLDDCDCFCDHLLVTDRFDE